ncbi:Homeobox-leucine zipper protein MERISTEM L1 [Striga hermonthica]|uniref:Homeobox-leucine zipper protein MERISTEM L1 n=1 Tax=Striga hermonthica TaxID=68872 RepID=A0A9N7ND48_STRHE|nr:Homeobox-leucine zipper protein MERISTEM L1 [Striga hermonthica]
MYQPNIFDSHHHHHLLDITHNKTPENDMDLIRDEEYESKSGTDIMEAPSGDDQDPNQRPKKKRYHRHTQNQIQEMESFFNECPHPDDKQRKELGRRLGLEPLQVKFWFQNKRTQMKAQHERHENTQLRNENEKLRAENIRYKEALSNATCPSCGGPAAIGEMSFDEQHLRIENARLREEIDRISGIAAKYVTWVEHVEIDDRAVHTIYKALVNSGLAFGARRWVATLDRQCERLASLMANNIAAGDIGVISSPEGRKSMLKLAERMVMSFCTGVGASTAHTWTTLSGSGADDVRVMTRKSMDDPGRPPGIVLSAATSFWLPVPPKRVFDFLRDENSRSEWDILSNGGLVQEMAHIANGRDPGNSVSLLRVNSPNSSQSNMLILQESSTDSTGSYVIYAPVDIVAMNVVLSGGDPDYVALLPSGFAILPDGPNNPTGPNPEVGSGGSLLTVAFQILVDSVPTAKLSLGSVATVNSLIKCTVERIKGAVLCDGS